MDSATKRSLRPKISQNFSVSAKKLKLDSITKKVFKINDNTSSSRSKAGRRMTLAKQVSRVALIDLLRPPQAIDSNVSALSRLDQEVPDFKSFLANRENVEIFRQFLKSQYCQENLEFYLACERYRQLDPDKVGREMVKFMATQIYNDFLGENARQPVNIGHDCLKEIIKNLRDPPINLLTDAQMHIFQLMRTDCYPRFCKTWLLDRDEAERILNGKSNQSDMLGTTLESSSKLGSNANSSLPSTNQTMNSTTHLDMTDSIVSNCCSSRRKSLKRPLGEITSSPVPSLPTPTASVSPALAVSCPERCPYFRLGLPCQEHDPNERLRGREEGDLIDRIDMGRMHHVPRICSRRTPPPPPLPPKPGKREPDLPHRRRPPPPPPPPQLILPSADVRPFAAISSSVSSSKRNLPYVGKVFHV